MKKFFAIFIAAFCLVSVGALANDYKLGQAYENHQSDIQVRGSGTVIRLLPDDNKGSRHQSKHSAYSATGKNVKGTN